MYAAALTVVAGLVCVDRASAGVMKIVSPVDLSYKPTAQTGTFDVVYTVPVGGPNEFINSFQSVVELPAGVTITGFTNPGNSYIYGNANYSPGLNMTGGSLGGFGQSRTADATVTAGSTVALARVQYTVPAKYVGDVPIHIVTFDDPRRDPLDESDPIATSVVQNNANLFDETTLTTGYVDGSFNVNAQTAALGFTFSNIQLTPGGGSVDVYATSSIVQYVGDLQVGISASGAGMAFTSVDAQASGFDTIYSDHAAENFATFYLASQNNIEATFAANTPMFLAKLNFSLAPSATGPFNFSFVPFDANTIQGQSGTYAADLSGLLDANDFPRSLASSFGSAPVLIPEPATSALALLSVGMVGGLRTRRRRVTSGR